MTIEIIILAAGKGTRMQSSIPKVLHEIAGKPMLQHLIETVSKLSPHRIHIVVSAQKELIISQISSFFTHTYGEKLKSQVSDEERKTTNLGKINWVDQIYQLGSGHAVVQAMPHVDPNSTVLILNGDTPLVSVKTLHRLVNSEGKLKILTVKLPDPSGMGRILRNESGNIIGIVEDQDADKNQLKIKEINTNCMAGLAKSIARWVNLIQYNNKKKEYYLPDIVTCALRDQIQITSIELYCSQEMLGVNSKLDLARLEKIYQCKEANQLMSKGVTIRDPDRIHIRGTCHFGMDCILDLNVVLEGSVKIGNHCYIGQNSIVKNSVIGNYCRVEPNSMIESSVIEDGCNVGPFARIRPGTHLCNKVHIGNFVETKKAHIDNQSKINHLSYVGDSMVGKNVNIGAGVIVCNYDGVNKHQTVIGNNVFIGSDSQLVAPVRIADGVTVGAGSTITDDVLEEKSLVTSRIKQKLIRGWKRPKKKKKNLT